MDVVVCDDDPGVRQVIAEIAGGLGFSVVAETDAPSEAVELVERFGAGVLVLDLSLPDGNGRDALRALRTQGSTCRVVVFSAYAFDPDRLRDDGADAVVDKLRFDELEEALARAGRIDRRRDLGGRVLPPPAAVTSRRGLEPADRFERALDDVRPADLVMVFELDGHDDLVAAEGDLFAADVLLDLAATLRHQTRVQDRLGGAGDRRLEAALLGSGPEGAYAVYERVRAWWAGRPPVEATGVTTFSAGFAVVEPGETPREALARAARALEVGRAARAGAIWRAPDTVHLRH